ncbi:hypothetical protein [Nocardia rhizosphaerihabitans]|uniref:Uncharacterized protein n=1 Tax=Nocardia rhizosphaerihabitans TaxID=1691570 RepID=A0ABQ2KP23_9NOCA|nr:hypothetical protein [Nocardia rhizosphaerihabitans]GGN85748.1 hypothetical protein GCM10011610_40330 [Nocardia rhizosphaerihabitans]
MRNHTGRMAIALGALASLLALGSGIAVAAPQIDPNLDPLTTGVVIKDPGAPALPYSCSVFGLGFAAGPATAAGTATGGFLMASPVIAVCTDPAHPVVLGNAG